MCYLSTGNLVIRGAFHPAAQQFNGMGCPLQFRSAFHGLHGQKRAAGLDQRQAQLAQQLQICHRPGGHQIKGFPVGLGKFLRPAVDTGHIVKAQVIAHPLQEGNPLLQGVQQGEADGGLQNPQRQAGKARAGAHVGHRLVPEVRQSQQGGAVEKMERGHFLRVCDGGEIHDLIGLVQQSGVALQGRHPVRGQPQSFQTAPHRQ